MKLRMKTIASAVAGALGLILLIVSILFMTALKPSGVVEASTPTNAKGHFVVSRPGVLELNAPTATITAEGKGDVVVAVGRTTDVNGWVAGLDYAEISGIEADDKLVIEQHQQKKGAKDDKAPSPEELSPAKADHWQKVETANNKVSMEWPQKDGQWSLIAYSAQGTPKVTLTWKTGASVGWAIPLLILGLLLIVVALVVYFLGRKSGSKEVSDEVAAPETGQQPVQEEQPAYGEQPRYEEPAYQTGEQPVYQTGELYGDEPAYEEPAYGDQPAYDEPAYGDQPTYEEPAYGDQPVEQPTSDTYVHQSVYDNVPVTGSPVNIEHSELTSSAQMYSSGVFPTRRQLREARKRGEETIEVGGQVFSTGLTPAVAEPATSPEPITDDPVTSTPASSHDSWEDTSNQTWDGNAGQTWDDNTNQTWDDNTNQTWDDTPSDTWDDTPQFQAPDLSAGQSSYEPNFDAPFQAEVPSVDEPHFDPSQFPLLDESDIADSATDYSQANDDETMGDSAFDSHYVPHNDAPSENIKQTADDWDIFDDGASDVDLDDPYRDEFGGHQ